MKKIIYNKTYTRDDCIILQQFWSQLFNEDNPSINWKKRSFPAVINYMNDGVIEIWENKKSINLYIKKILDKNRKDPKFFNDSMEKYAELLNNMEKYWDKKTISNKKELKYFVELIPEAMYYFSIMYYSVLNDKTSKAILKKAIEFRKNDIFFDKCDKLIRNSLVAINPKVEGLESAILLNEITNPPKLSLLIQRKNNFIVIGKKHAKIISLFNFLKKNSKYYFKQDRIKKELISNIKGIVAYGGHVTGEVIVIDKKEKINKFKNGQIIVSAMTTPELISIIREAKAIVTDEGGMLSHAAIISREMKKPCIIGTKIATQVLKDGDLVEVDADKGVVKIIKKTKK